MTGLILVLAASATLLILLLIWMRRTASVAGSGTTPWEAREALTTFQLEPPPRALVERIFAVQDWGFVSSRTPARIQRIFLQERKAIVHSVLGQTRQRVAQLMNFHRRAVRRNVKLSLAIEIGLALRYLQFLFVYGILRGLIQLGGPLAARRMVGHAVGLADQLSLISGGILAGLDPARFGRIRTDWRQRSIET